jgi:hypothetical protein
MRIWWWLGIDMAGTNVEFIEAAGASGDPVLESGGVSGAVYGTGSDCDCSTACNMIAVCWYKCDDGYALACRQDNDM